MPRPLDCDRILDRLEAFIDGDLDAAASRSIETHLERCPACRAEHQLAADIRRELRALPELDAPPEVLRGVFRQVGTERFRPRIVEQPAWAALAAAVFAALVIGGGLLFSQRSEVPATAPIADAENVDPEEIARATEEARLAFAHLARVSQKAGFKLRDDLGEHLVEPSTESLLRALGPTLGSRLGGDRETANEGNRS